MRRRLKGNSNSIQIGALTLLLTGFGTPARAGGPTFDHGEVFQIIEENDLFLRTDRHYTQGIKLTFLQEDNNVPRWAARCADAILPGGFSVHAHKFGYEIGQNIYTPANIDATEALPLDRPYAGFLYTGLIIQRRGLTASGHLVLDNLQLDLGIIGQESLAKEAQTWVHEIRDIHRPQGWDHQLSTEPGFALRYQRSWLFTSSWDDAWRFDLMPHAGVSLGNVETSARAGATLRFGWHVPDDFGPQTIDSLSTTEGGWSPTGSTGRWGLYVWGGFEGHALAYTTFLDGNLFHDSPHVDKEPLVGDVKAGFVFVLRRVELGYTQVFRSPEFRLQTQHDGFGSLFFRYKF